MKNIQSKRQGQHLRWHKSRAGTHYSLLLCHFISAGPETLLPMVNLRNPSGWFQGSPRHPGHGLCTGNIWFTLAALVSEKLIMQDMLKDVCFTSQDWCCDSQGKPAQKAQTGMLFLQHQPANSHRNKLTSAFHGSPCTRKLGKIYSRPQSQEQFIRIKVKPKNKYMKMGPARITKQHGQGSSHMTARGISRAIRTTVRRSCQWARCCCWKKACVDINSEMRDA